MAVTECSAKSLYSIKETKKAITDEEETNYLRIINLMLRVAPQAVRVQFDQEFFPGGLQKVLNQNKFKVLEPLKRKRVINQKQWDLLFPRTGEASSSSFDLTLMICLMRNLADIPVGDILPLPLDMSSASDLSRMKHYRNLVAHCDDATLSNIEFQEMWTDISQAVVRLGGIEFQQKCYDLKVSTLDKNDMEICNEFRNNERSNNPIAKGLQELLDHTIDGWKILDKQVVETSAIQHLKELATTSDMITVIGSPGCGKSTAVHHLALQLHHYQGYDIIDSHDPMDLRNYFNPERKQIFVFDDVYGKYMLEQPKIETWSRLSKDINMVLQKKTVKIFSSCRTHIYNPIEKDDIICRTVCNLLSDELILTVDERVLMAGKYLPEDIVSALMLTEHFNKYDFFPLLCKLSANKTLKEIDKLFSRPVDFVRHDLLSMMKLGDQTTIATLFLFVIYNNCLTKEILGKNSETKTVLLNLSEEFKMPYVFSIKIVKQQLEFLMQSYVIGTENKYTVIHDKIFDIMLSFFGQYAFDLVIEYAHSDIIRDRFQFESIGTPDSENIIIVSTEKEADYIERLCTDMKKGNVENVFLNHQLKYQLFRTKLISLFEQNKADLAGPMSIHSNKKSSPLLIMTKPGYCDMIRLLIDMNLDINVCDEYQRTPLFISCWEGNVDIVNLLLNNKCNPDLCNKYGMSSLYVASWMGFLPIVKLLLEGKCNMDNEGHKEWNPLFTASNSGHNSVVELLLQHNCFHNLNIFDLKIPFCITLLKKHLKIAKIILRPACCSDTCNKYSKSTLSIVLHKMHATLFKSFVEPLNEKDIEQYFKKNMIKKYVLTLLSSHKCYSICCDNILREYKLSFLISIAYEYEDVFSLLLRDHIHVGNICQDEISPLMLTLENENLLNMLLENDFLQVFKLHQRLLCRAASQGFVKTVKLLLQYNLNPNDCNNLGESQLYLAIKYDNADTAKLLIHNKADLNIVNPNSNAALCVASAKGHTEIVKLLLEHKCDTNFVNEKSNSAMYAASAKGHIEIVKLLLEHKCDPNTINEKNNSALYDASAIGHSNSALYFASVKGHTEIVKLLLKEKCDPNVVNEKSNSSLYAASAKGHTKIVKLLLEHKCDPNTINEKNNSALYAASAIGHTKIVKLLLEHKCDPNIINEKSNSALYAASAIGHTEIVKLLLKHKCDPNIKNEHSNHSLFAASAEGHTEIVKHLLEHKCDPNVVNENSNSAVYAASAKGHTEIVKLLLEHKCDPNIVNERCNSALFVAAGGGQTEIVKLLLEHKCDQNIVNEYGNSALFIASAKGHTEIVKLLLEHKCDPNIENEHNNTAVYAASAKGHTEIVKVLLEYKCDPNIVNQRRNSALFVASAIGYIEIVRLLLDNGSNPHYCNRYYESPIYIASHYGMSKIVELLLSHSLDHRFCKEGKAVNTEIFITNSALYAATKQGYTDIVELLLGYTKCKSKIECPLYGILIDRDAAMQYADTIVLSDHKKKIKDFIRLYTAQDTCFPLISDLVPIFVMKDLKLKSVEASISKCH